MTLLTLNCGSSSVKYSVYDPAARAFLCRGIVDRVGQAGSVLQHVRPAQGARAEEKRTVERPCPDHVAAVALVLEALDHTADIRAVGHRVVHGGERFARSARIGPALLEAVEQMSALAPLHNPPNLAGIRAAQQLLPAAAQVAVFDTAFHQTMPPEAYLYALPYDWYERHRIRRYGFHGTSHLYVSLRAAAVLRRRYEELRIVTLHVGNGASAAAISGGQSRDTSMGFTPLEGLVMGTRSGSIDPALPLYLMERENLTAAQMDQVLNKKSGLLGLTGRFSDRRDIQREAEAGDARCQLALEIECRCLKKTIGSYAAVLGGLDCVVFTAGVGENSALIRAKVLSGLEFLGIQLDPGRNATAVGGKAEALITRDHSPVAALVIPTNEELVIAEDTLAIVEERFDRADFRYSFA